MVDLDQRLQNENEKLPKQAKATPSVGPKTKHINSIDDITDEVNELSRIQEEKIEGKTSFVKK